MPSSLVSCGYFSASHLISDTRGVVGCEDISVQAYFSALMKDITVEKIVALGGGGWPFVFLGFFCFVFLLSLMDFGSSSFFPAVSSPIDQVPTNQRCQFAKAFVVCKAFCFYSEI